MILHFISKVFACKLNKPPDSLGFQLIISTYVGVKVVASTKNKNYKVVIGETKTLTDLIKMGEMEFDFILGKD